MSARHPALPLEVGVMSVGESLARAREERGLSIADVSDATRIRATLIRSIEADDFASCGGNVYARGHIRSIAHVVGVDAEPLVEEFDRAHGGSPVAAVVTPAFDPDVAHSTARRKPNWSAAMVAALLIIIVIALVPMLTRHGGGAGPTAESTTPAVRTSASTSPTPAPSSAATSAPPLVAQVPHDVVTVQLRVVSTQTWCSVRTVAGQTLFEGLLSAGQQRLFKDPKGLKLIIGNAPAVDLIVNGHDIGTPPAQGNVSRITVGPGDANVTAG